MERTKPDLWTLVGPNPTVVSYFKLPLAECRHPDVDTTAFFQSEGCGLGWSFILEAMNSDISQPTWSAMEIVKHTRFKILLAATPHHTSDEAKKITVAVVTNGSLIEKASDVSFPCSTPTLLATYLSAPNFAGDWVLEFHVKLPVTFTHAPDRGITLKLRHALSESVIGKELGDLNFALFTRRGQNHTVTHPEVICANHSLLQGYSAFLDQLLLEPRDTKECERICSLTSETYDTFDYESDSDLETGSSSDGDLCDLDSLSLSSRSISRQKKAQSVRRGLKENESALLIRNTAYKTWKALVLYLYTNTKVIDFKPLTSSRAAQNARMSAINSDTACSPKSMYRLAQKIGSADLQKISLDAIIQGLSENNIVDELFSHFTSMYQDIQNAEIKALGSLLKSPAATKRLSRKLKDVAVGNLPHCGEILAAIMVHLVDIASTERPCAACLKKVKGKDKDNSEPDDKKTAPTAKGKSGTAKRFPVEDMRGAEDKVESISTPPW